MSTMGYVTTLTGAEDSASISLDFEKQSYKVMEGGKQVSKSFDDIFTFSRSTIGGRVNEKGVYEMVAVNQPRFDYDPVTKLLKGLLVEEQRVNLLPSSQPYTPATFSKSGDVTFKPTGLLGAGMQFAGVFPAGTATGVSYCYSQSIQATVSTTYTLSVFVRYADGRQPKFGAMASTNSPLNDFAMIVDGSGRLPNTYVVDDFGNGLYRFSVTAPSQATQAVRGFGIIRYAGQGAADSPELLVTGYQLEQADFATSYIPTTTTFTSRASTATYFDNKGVLKTAGVNIARSSAYIYDQSNKLIPVGLLLETSATNLIRLSTDLSLAPWSRTQSNCLLSEGGVAPDGSVAQMFTMVGTTGHNITHSLSAALVVGTTYTLSVWLRSPNWGNKQFQLAYYDGGTVQVGAGGSVIPTAEWKRYEYTFSPTAVAATPQIRLIGYSNGAAGDKVEIFGPQLEVGVMASSYIQTGAVFTARASTATYIDATGTIQTAEPGVARANTYKYDANKVLRPNGLLLESSATNFVKYSNGFGAGWTDTSNAPAKLVVTQNFGLAPDGSQTSTMLEFPPKASATTQTWNQQVGQLSANTTLSPSIWIKADAPVSLNIRQGDGQLGYITIGVTTEWTRYTSPSGINTGTTFNFGVAMPLSATTTETARVQIWGAQLESGTYPTSEIKTEAVSVTRAADVFTTTTVTRAADVYSSVSTTRAFDAAWINNIAAWWNPTEGTVDTSYTPGAVGLGGTTTAYYMRSAVNANNSVVALRRHSNGQVIAVGTDAAGATQFQLVGATIVPPPYGRLRGVTSLKANNFSLSVNGRVAVKTATGTLPQPDRLHFGNPGTNSQNTNGHVQSFAYYPMALSDSQIESLSN